MEKLLKSLRLCVRSKPLAHPCPPIVLADQALFFESGKIRDLSSKPTAIPWLSARRIFPEALIQACCESCFFFPPSVRIISTFTFEPTGSGLSVIRKTPFIEISLVTRFPMSVSELSPGNETKASSWRSNLSTFLFSITMIFLCVFRWKALKEKSLNSIPHSLKFIIWQQ